MQRRFPNQTRLQNGSVFGKEVGFDRPNTRRVTVFLLRLNDPDRMMDRKLLINTHRYPRAASG